VIVTDAISKIESIGCVRLKCIVNFNANVFTGTSRWYNFWLGIHGRRNNKLFLYVLYFNIFIKINFNFLTIKMDGIIFWFCFSNYGRLQIFRATFWCTPIGAINEKSAYNNY